MTINDDDSTDNLRVPPSDASITITDDSTVNLRVDYPERLSRVLLFFKWLFVIPALVVIFLYGIAVFITTFISFWAILITGSYPTGLFNFARGYMALQARTYAYFPLLLTDQYPLPWRGSGRLGAGEDDALVRYEVERADELSRWGLLLKLFAFFVGIIGQLVYIVGLFLVLFVAIPSWFIILFSGRMPRPIFNFVLSLAQWCARVTSWQWLMRDESSLFATTYGVRVLVWASVLVYGGLIIVASVA